MAGYYTQKRQQPLWTFEADLQTNLNGQITKQKSYEQRYHLQETTSFRSRPGEGSYQTRNDLLASSKFGSQSIMDNGHEFSTVSCRVYGVNTYKSLGYNSAGTKSVYGAAQLKSFADATLNGTPSPTIPSWDVTTRNAQGNRAVAATQPTSSGADLSTFLGEFLREGLPSVAFASFLPIIRSKSDLLRRAGSEYLNAQFGWVPLIKELEKLLRVVSDSYKMLEQYKRDSGKVVRRSFAFPVERRVSTSSVIGNTNAFYYDNWYLGRQSDIADTSITTTITDKIYFRGAYSYYIPTEPGLMGDAERFASYADYLLGIKLTPEVLWNLAPWTWLSDWFVNIGDNLSVASRFQKDNLVLRYGYLMRHYQVKQEHTSTNHVYRLTSGPNKGFRIPNLRQTIVKDSKRRIRAEPYGFGFNTEALTSVQWAVLGALGLSDIDSKDHDPFKGKSFAKYRFRG